MQPLELLRIAWEAILKNKVRSLLTMLGIIIGVGAVIIMIAISAGTEATISDQITSLGSNLIFVQSTMMRGGPGQAASSGLVYDDAAAIQDGVDGVKSVVVEQQSSENVKVGDTLLEDVDILGTTIGLFIPSTLQNGFVIIGIQPFWQQVVVGAVLITAVYVDQQRRAAALRGGSARMSGLLGRMISRQGDPARE